MTDQRRTTQGRYRPWLYWPLHVWVRLTAWELRLHRVYLDQAQARWDKTHSQPLNPAQQAALAVCRAHGEVTDQPCAWHQEAVDASVVVFSDPEQPDANDPHRVSRRAHMDCFTSPNNCWVGDEANCPMAPAKGSPDIR